VSLCFFTNQLRWLKIILPAAILAGLCAYSFFEGPRRVPFLSSSLRDPEAFDGCMVAAAGCRVAAVNGAEFTVSLFGQQAVIKGIIPGLEKGQYVDVLGRFHKEGWLAMEKYHVSSRSARLIKLGVSLFPPVVVGLLLVASFPSVKQRVFYIR